VQQQNIAQIERELERRFETIQKQSSYEVFGVWEGCGSDVVKERYYALVKENHPDRYGGNVSDKVKRLSQEIFLQIQKSFRQLLKVETIQRKPDPNKNTDRAAAIDRLSKLANQKTAERRDSEPAEASSQAPPITTHFHEPAPEPGMSAASEVFEAVTISTRDADTIEEDSLPEEERRAKLARLARLARNKPTTGTTRTPSRPIHNTSPPSSNVLDEEERRAKLARLASKRSAPPAMQAPTRTIAATPAPTSRDDQSSPGPQLTTQKAQLPTDPQTPKDHFNLGYHEFRIKKRPRHALQHLEQAYQGEPQNALYSTYYGYVLFLIRPEEKATSEQLLKQALESNDRTAAPDAHLFMGYLLKTHGSDKKKQQAHKHFQQALALNPASHEAEREIRLYEKRQQQQQQPRPQDDVGAFLGKFFKK
jgi:curved DNA-binding protein CbpA